MANCNKGKKSLGEILINSYIYFMKIIINGIQYELEDLEYKYFIDFLRGGNCTIEEIEQFLIQLIKEKRL